MPTRHRTAAAPRTLVLAGLLVALAAPAARAQRAVDRPPNPDRPVEFAADLGLVSTAGNTKVTTFNVAERIIVRFDGWGLTQRFGLVYGRSDGEENANLWRSSIRLDRKLTPLGSFYGLVNFERNPFAGVAERFEEGLGLAALPVTGGRDTVSTELGLSLVQQRSTSEVRDRFASGRAAAAWKHRFAEKAHLYQFAEVLPNLRELDDLRINTETSLVSPLSRAIAVKLSYVIRFDNVPEPGFVTTDQIFTSGLSVVF